MKKEQVIKYLENKIKSISKEYQKKVKDGWVDYELLNDMQYLRNAIITLKEGK